MTTDTHGVGPLDVTFTETLRLSPAEGGWTYIVWPESPASFGARGRVKVRGTVDGGPTHLAYRSVPMGLL